MSAGQGDGRERPAAVGAGDDGAEGRIQGATENMPPVPDAFWEAARLAPDHWLGMVDPVWSGEGDPPAWALVGQWRSSSEGEIVEWRDNEEYRPSPSALGWPEPADDVDSAVQLAATGYGSAEAVTEALAAWPEVAVFVTAESDPLAATAPDGVTRVIPVFTSPVHLHTAGRLAFELVSVRELADWLPGDHVLYLNPSAAVSMTVETDMLLDALDRVPVGDVEEAEYAAPRPATVSGGEEKVSAELRPGGARGIEEVPLPVGDDRG